MTDDRDPVKDQFLRLMALHKYFLNADFLRDVFMKRLVREKSPRDVDSTTAIDDQIAMALWYATLYVVIEGWRETGLSDPDVDRLLSDGHSDRLRRFRNQLFHYQREYDNPRLLEFLGADDDEAREATRWVRQTHAQLGRAIEKAVAELIGTSLTTP